MGGRGSSSGMSADREGNLKNPYGSQYHTVLEYENIKFVTNRGKNPEALMETMTPGRIYVQTGGNDLLRIIQFDENNHRNRVIELDKRTRRWHVHEGYFHAEQGRTSHVPLTGADQKLLDKVKDIWYHKGKIEV